MSLHKEIKFEDEICEHLAANGWLYADKDAADYDRQLALFPADVLAWVQETQPNAWEVVTKNHGSAADETLLNRLRDSINQSGTLHVLRHGFDVLGVKSKVKMAQFKPALAMNPDIIQRYAANRLRVVRQVRYSLHNENSIDLVLLLNGIPIATAELKTDFTQSIDDAVDQYRFARDPSPKGQNPEPLLAFPSGALVHFAVSSSEVKMTTKLIHTVDNFLPFNQGSNSRSQIITTVRWQLFSQVPGDLSNLGEKQLNTVMLRNTWPMRGIEKTFVAIGNRPPKFQRPASE